jgi:hypothetical protein
MMNRTLRCRESKPWRLPAVGAAFLALLPVAAYATASPLSVQAGPDSFSANPADAGVQASAHLTALVTNPPQVQSQAQLVGPAWAWAIQSVQFEAPGAQGWSTAGAAYYQATIDQPDPSLPDATLTASLLRAGNWQITVVVTVDYSDNLGNTWHGTATEIVSEACSLNATILVRRTGSGNAFSPSAIIAAGGLAGDVHRADVRLQVSPTKAGIYVDNPVLLNYEGINGGNASVSLTSNLTDAAGQVSGAFVSSNKAEAVTLQIAGPTTGGAPPQAVALQHWDDLSSGADWAFDAFFEYDVASPVTFQPALVDGAATVPITGHTMNFLVTGLDLWQWDDAIQDYDYLTNVDPSILPGLAVFSPATVGDSGGGKYTSQQTVWWNDLDVVDNVYFDAQDADVYHNMP